jgi:hypothetical protein
MDDTYQCQEGEPDKRYSSWNIDDGPVKEMLTKN